MADCLGKFQQGEEFTGWVLLDIPWSCVPLKNDGTNPIQEFETCLLEKKVK